MIDVGSPCSLNTWSINKSATCGASTLLRVAIKWAILLNRSITTQIVSFCLWVLGNPTMKSTEILFQLDSGICKGISRPGGLTLSALLTWHWKHSWTYWQTSLANFGHQNVLFTNWVVLSTPGCLVQGASWLSNNTFFQSSLALGTQILPFLLR